MTPTIILVSGLSCTGKTTLAKQISKRLNLPYFSKDMFKETLFDRLGIKDRAWSQSLGRASYDLLYLIARNLVSRQLSLILESNFKPQYDRPRLQQLQSEFPLRFLEILCFADGQILFQRFKDRALSGLRHPGHVDQLCLDEQETILSPGKAEPLNLGEVIEINTTDFSRLDYPQILSQIEAKFSNSPKNATIS
jgi:predicted kinase